MLRTPTDLLAAIPYLLGFHPAPGSLVTIGLGIGGHIAVTARIDYTDSPADSSAGSRSVPATAAAADLPDRLDTLADAIARNPVDTVVLAGYGPADPVDTALAATAAAFTARGIAVRAAVRVTDGRHTHLTCTDPGCCPPDGEPFDPGTSTAPADFTLAGMVALADRDTVAAQIAPVTGPAREQMRRATVAAATRLTRRLGHPVADHRARHGADDGADDGVHHVARRLTAAADTAADTADRAGLLRRLGAETIQEAVDRTAAGERLSDEQAATLILLLADTGVRDQAWQRHSSSPDHRDLWADLTRRAEPGLVAAPATLLAVTAWQRGDGVLAQTAIDRALAADPRYTAALILGHAVRSGIPPQAFAQRTFRPPHHADPAHDAGHHTACNAADDAAHADPAGYRPTQTGPTA